MLTVYPELITLSFVVIRSGWKIPAGWGKGPVKLFPWFHSSFSLSLPPSRSVSLPPHPSLPHPLSLSLSIPPSLTLCLLTHLVSRRHTFPWCISLSLVPSSFPSSLLPPSFSTFFLRFVHSKYFSPEKKRALSLSLSLVDYMRLHSNTPLCFATKRASSSVPTGDQRQHVKDFFLKIGINANVKYTT